MEYSMLILSWISIILSIAAASAAFLKKKSGGLGILAAGMYLSGVFLFFTLFTREYPILQSILYAAIRTLQMFLLNNSLEDLISSHGDISMLFAYSLGFLHIAAPILSATAILAALSSRFAYLRCHISLYSDKFIFSEVNKNSLALAASIKSSKKRAIIIFVDDNTGRIDQALLDSVKSNGFFLLKKSMDALFRPMKYRFCEYHFFTISNSRDENLSLAIKLIEKYIDNLNVFVYTFSGNKEAEEVLDSIKSTGPKVNIRIINEAQTIAYELLQNNPVYQCFHENEKAAEVLLIGLGSTGTEILKGMIWCNQYLEHRVSYTICDINAKERESFFRRSCPALDLEKYHIRFCQENLNISDDGVFGFLNRNPRNYHYIVISTGSDDLNLSLAMDLKSFFSRRKTKPCISVLIRDKMKLEIVKNYMIKDSKQEIYLFGCSEDLYRCERIVDETVQKIAMGVNLVYEDVFHSGTIEHADTGTAYEKWNALTSVLQRSNKALALHIQYRLWEQGCQYTEESKPDKSVDKKGNRATTGAKKHAVDYLEDVLHNDEAVILRYAKLEHERWSAYMLTEGWFPFEKGEQVTSSHYKLPAEKKHGAIKDWEPFLKLDRALPDKMLLFYDSNFVKKTGLILSGLDHRLDYSFQIVSLPKSASQAQQIQNISRCADSV